MRRHARFVILLSALVLPWQARAQEPAVFGKADPPHGFVRFCDEIPTECVPDNKGVQKLQWTKARYQQLVDVNNKVNRSVDPVTDLDNYGVNEYWTLPANGRGDCEDYVLQKRHDLIKKGWPVSSLLITVVRDEKGDGHAVLLASTTKADYVLDVKDPDVKVWLKTPYQYVMRQSTGDPTVWVSLVPSVVVGSAPASR
ncbi:transglutaminase-like cysteine peptidase [Candidatus Kaiserbacteria bacterium]|nr:transglutaminase-like cysteine peptidase [Candidatus Kaiserbacteria bacterium]